MKKLLAPSLLALLTTCGHPLIFGNGAGTDEESGGSVSTPDSPLADGERPTGTLQTFVQIVNTLPYPVAHSASLQIGNKVYVFGGIKTDVDGQTNPITTTQILVSTIGSDGNLGTFSVSGYTMATARRAFRAVRVGNWVYLIGGYSNTDVSDSGGTDHLTVERAPIVNDELSGNFTVASPTLPVNRDNYALLKTSSYIYIIGGTNQLDSIDRAPISGGEISGNFTTLTRSVVSGTQVSNGLVTPRYTHDITVIGDTVYVVGGSDVGSSLDSIEEAQVTNGVLGDFHLISPNIGTGRNRIIVAGLNADVYVFAGWDAGFLTSVFSTALVGGKITTNFTSVSGVTLADGVENGVSLLTRSAMYYMGGYNTSGGGTLYNYVQRAAISN